MGSPGEFCVDMVDWLDTRLSPRRAQTHTGLGRLPWHRQHQIPAAPAASSLFEGLSVENLPPPIFLSPAHGAKRAQSLSHSPALPTSLILVLVFVCYP